jgi:sensor histidine kinase YesM
MLTEVFANSLIFFMFQFEEGNYDWAIPLIVSNFITILLMFFFTKDRSQQEIAFQQQIAKLEAHSLRAQMNPHFIFNALNGVQSVMMLQGEQMANRYLGVFSKLLRFTIEMTNSEMISLEDELGYLNSYVELQNLRLENEIDFMIDIDSTVDAAQCFLPTMMLQPLVEKAIIHGVSTLKDKRTILLKIERVKNILILKVEDNGIGRKESDLLRKNQKGGVHKSFANQIMKERIDIFNYLQDDKTNFYMEDVFPNKKHSGTRAILTIPFREEKSGIINKL